MKKIMSTQTLRSLLKYLLSLVVLSSFAWGQTFVTAGGTVTSGYWNSSNTSGTFSFVIPNDNTIAFLALNIDVNDAENYAEIGAQEFGVTAQQSKTYSRTATQIETAGSFSDGDTYDIYVVFYKTSGGVAAVDTMTLGTNIKVDETAPAAFQVGTVVSSGGNVVGGYWNDTNTQLAVTVPIANDATLQGGSLQITGFVGGNPAEDLGSTANVLIINTNQTVNLSDTDFVNKVWFLDSQTFSLNATLSDAAGNSTDGTASVTTLTIDQSAPTISSITSTTADGTYGVGESINVTVNFDEAVTLSNGNLLTDLNAGGQLTTTTINSATDFSATYTVAEGDDAASLNVDSFSFSGGTTKLLDAAGNNADLVTLASNLEDNTNIVVDGTTPTVSEISSTTAAGSYGVDEVVNITVTFTEALTLSGGNLLVTHDASGTDVVISPFSSSTTASGSYTVADGDASSALDVTSLSLSGGTLVDAGGNTVDLDLTGVTNIDDTKTIAIDGAAPAAFTTSTVTITGGDVVAGYWNSTNTGMTVIVPVANDATLNGGTVQIQGFFGDISGAENIGSTSDLNGSHLGGNITVTLAAVDIEALTGFTDGATLKLTAVLADAGGNSTTGTTSANTFDIDQTAPTISSISSTSSDGTYGIGDGVNVTIAFSENVTISGGNLLTVMNTSVQLSTAAIAGTNSVSQTYTISALEETADVTVSSVSLSGGAVDLVDAAGNPTDLSLPVSNLGTTSAIEIDGIVPTISSITSSTADGSYGVGDVVNIRVTFSETVTLAGGTLDVDHDASATDVSITTITNALFGEQNYTIADGDASDDLAVTALSLSAGTLQDAGGNDVDLSDLTGITNIDDGSDIYVDGAAPADFTVGTVTVTGGDVVASYWNATNTGLTIAVPIAADNGLIGGSVQIQGYFNDISGAVDVGSASTITGGHIGGNLTVTLTAIQVEGIPGFADDEVLKLTAVMTDDGGNSTVGTQSANTFAIDQVAPSLSTITSTTANGTYGVGDDVNITLTFDESVTLAGGNLITTLDTGTELTATTISATPTVSQTYTIVEGDEETDLSVTDIELSVGTATLTDAAGNEASLTLPGGDNLADNSALVIDGIYPTLSSIGSTSNNGSYGVNQTINITVTFSEAVTLSGGNLEVDIDASATDVLITSISSSTSGSRTYTVASGDDSDDLTVTALSLSAGTLQDAGGNDVDLSDLTGVSNIADTKNIIVDGDAPAAFTVSSVVTTGGVVVADYWNASNTGLNVTVPIANDASLQGGKVIILGRAGSNAFETVGDSSNILAVNTNKTISLTNLSVEGITGYEESAILSFSAVIRDDVYNSTTGTVSATTLTVDETAPALSSITSNPVSGTLGVGSTADITVTYDENVTLAGGGSIAVILETGDTDVTLTESDVTNSATFVETYTISEDEASADLAVTSVSLGSGSLRDAAGNNASETLPSGNNLQDNSALVIDGVIPSILTITSSSPDANYALDATIDVTLTFSEALTLAGGTLLVTLETGATDRVISISTINNSTTASGTYTVQTGDESTDLTVSSIALSAGTLVDAASNDLDLTLPSGASNLAGSSDILVDGTVPPDFTVGSVITTGGTVVTSYWNNTNTGVQVVVPIANDASLQGGRIQIMARTGANVYANFGADAAISSVGVNKTMTFTFSILEGVTGYEEGAVIQFAAIITDNIGNSTTGTSSATTLTVDTTNPSISSITSVPISDELAVGESADITITFSENVTLANGNLLTTLETGDTDAVLTTTAIAATNTVTETYTVSEDEMSADLNVSGVAPSSGTLRDVAGNNAVLSLPVENNLSDNSALVVDGEIPYIVNITSTADDAASYGQNSVIDITVNFSEPVTFSGGSFFFNLITDQPLTQVQLSLPNNSTTATGNYTVADGDASSNLSVESVQLGLATLQDAAGNNTVLDIPADGNLDDSYDFVVDGSPPGAITLGEVISTAGTVVTDYYNGTNTGVRVTVPILEDASLLNGSVQLRARVGVNAFEDIGAASTILATNTSKIMTLTSAQIVLINEYAEDVSITFTAVITDVVGNATTASVSANVLTVDRVDPIITEITSAPISDNLSVGESVDITVSFSEEVTLANGDLITTLETGDTDATLTTTAFVGETSVTETYTVIEDESSLDLDVILVSPSGAGTVRDAAGNEADLSLPVGDNLADNSAIIVDGNIPTIVGITSSVTSDILGLGESLFIDVEFSKALTLVGGNMVLTLDNGRTATISPFNLTTEPTATYTVQIGDESNDLTVSSIALSAGSLRDAAENNADLTLPSGNNLGDNSAIQVDGIVPLVFDTGTILTIGAPVVTGYWNEDNTGFQVIIQEDGTDLSMNGGSVQLQARMNANAFADIGANYPVTTNPVTITITEAQLESDLAGFLAGGTIQVRGVRTDIAGNSTALNTSATSLIIDETDPTQTTTGDLVVSGGNEFQGYWNTSNSTLGTLTVNTTLDNDASLEGGTIQVQMSVDAGGYSDIGAVTTLGAIDLGGNYETTLSAAELTGLGILDGDELNFIAVVTDIAGNETIGLAGANSIIVDYTDPGAFTVGAVTTTGGNEVANYFNFTNTGLEVVIPIETLDNTVVGGNVQLRISVNGGAEESILLPVDIDDLTVLTIAVTAAEIEAVIGFAEDVDLTFDAIVTDVAGNATLGTISTTDLTVDQVLPVDYASEDIRATGGNTVSGYWNATNTHVLVKVPITNDGSLSTDASLIGGTLAVLGDLAPPGNETYETFATTHTIPNLSSDTIAVTIPAGELEGLNAGGFDNRLQIFFRTSITDIAGNLATSATSGQVLLIDQQLPAVPVITEMIVRGTNIVEGVFSSGADSLIIALPIPDPDETLVGGYVQVLMSVGTASDENLYELVVEDQFTIPMPVDTIRLGSADIEALADFADGLTLFTKILIRDIAGNEAIGVASVHEILIDVNPPDPFTAGALVATGGTVISNSFNSTNTGIRIEIPLAADATLVDGKAILMVSLSDLSIEPFVSSPFVRIDSVNIGADNTLLVMTADSARLNDLVGYEHNYLMVVTAALSDYAGNEIVGTQSANELVLDFIAPDEPNIISLLAVGEPVVESYWNEDNTALSIFVETLAQPLEGDPSLLGGFIQVQGKYAFAPAWEDLGSIVNITSATDTELEVTILASELEALADFDNDGFGLDLRVYIEDGSGNGITGITMEDTFYVDQIDPTVGNFIAGSTTAGPYINAEDTLYVAWESFSDAHSALKTYHYSIGSGPGLSDIATERDYDVSVTSIDTLFTYVHGSEHYLNISASDTAGNVSSILSSSKITADLIAPISTIEMDSYYFIDNWNDSLQGTFSDELSGVDSLQFTLSRHSDSLFWNGSSWTAIETILNADSTENIWHFDLTEESLQNRVDYTIEMVAIDSAGNRQDPSISQDFQFVINTPPVMTALEDGSVDEDVLFTYTLEATDVDLGSISGDILTYSLLDGPDSMVVTTDTLTNMGELNWTPENADVGINIIKIGVTDDYGEMDSTQFILIVLQVNDPPEPVTLLSLPNATQITADSMQITFTWTNAFDIEGDNVDYLITYFQAGNAEAGITEYSETLTSDTNFVSLDVSELDFPYDSTEWYVVAQDVHDSLSVESSRFKFHTSAALASINTDSIAVNMDRYSNIDTTFNLKNLGLTDLRWELFSAPSWITFTEESGTVEFSDSSDIAINVDISAFTVGSYEGLVRLTYNDLEPDTLDIKVTMGIYDTPTPVLAFYQNPAFPAHYQLMIVDSLGMMDTLIVRQGSVTLLDTAGFGKFNFSIPVEFASDGTKAFEVYAANWTGDTTITTTVSVSLLRPNHAWLAKSPDELFEIQGNSGSIYGENQVTILDSLLSSNDDASYSVLADGVELAEPVLVSMPDHTGVQALYLQDDSGQFVELPSIGDGTRVSAWSRRMGAFKLGPRTIIIPERSELAQNYPNPFNPSTTIRFDVGFLDGLNQDIQFGIYNIRGQEVKQLMNTQLQPGSYAVTWNGLDDTGRQVSSGIYFARLMTGKGYVKTVKMLVLR